MPPKSRAVTTRRSGSAKKATRLASKQLQPPPPNVLLLEHHDENADNNDSTIARTDMLDEPATKADADDDDDAAPLVVTRPAAGFFIAGSSISAMNGVYVQQSAPVYDDDDPGTSTLLYYCHTQNLWTLECVSRKRVAAWALIDEDGRERFSLPGSKLVPGAGVRWTRREPPEPPAGSAIELRVDDPHAVAAAAVVGSASGGDEADDELPWQVIAILDRDTLQEVLAGADAHRSRVHAEQEAMAARSGLRSSGRAGGHGAVDDGAAGAEVDVADDEQSSSETCAIAEEGDHYVVLSVGRDASAAQLVQAYRMASLKYHPDRRSGSTAAFQRVQLAYETLADDAKRAAYDAGGSAAAAAGGEQAAFNTRWRDEYCPFGDPFVHRRKLVAERERQRREAEAKSKPKTKRGAKE